MIAGIMAVGPMISRMFLGYSNKDVYPFYAGRKMRGQDYLIGIVPKDKFDECYKWAFGEDVASLSTMGSPRIWNERHGDLFVLEGYQDVVEGTKKIGRAFMKYLKDKNE